MLPTFDASASGFSALQRAEIAEIRPVCCLRENRLCFSALQRAEIAEIQTQPAERGDDPHVSVLFNEPKLLKFCPDVPIRCAARRFSALQRAEIAEIVFGDDVPTRTEKFQCSSTSRNC